MTAAVPGGGGADARYAIPELARGVRALGGAGDPLAQACLAPLLAARRALVGETDPARQLALCDPDRLTHAVREAIAALATTRVPDEGPGNGRGEGPAWRAEEARLEEGAQPLFRALDRLRTASRALAAALEGAPAAVPAAWARWLEALQGAFRAAGEASAAR